MFYYYKEVMFKILIETDFEFSLKNVLQLEEWW
jgi:hypothetical protein